MLYYRQWWRKTVLVPLYASWTCTRRCSGGDTLPCSLWTPNFAGKASVCVFRACSCLALPIKLFFLWVFQVLGVTWMTLPAKFTYWRTQLWGSTGLHAVLLWSVGKIMENEAKYENIKGGWLSVRKSGGSLWNQSKSIIVEWILILSNLSVVISGTNLVKKAIYAMVEGDCDEVRDSLALNW